MEIKIIETITRFIKNPNTKTTYNQVEQEKNEITEKNYNYATNIDTIKFMKRLGGSESKQMRYTCYGYKCVKSVSISPDKENKTIREYTFIYE